MKSSRKNFTLQDDVILLRQINADLPFMSARGDKMGKWDTTAEKVMEVPDFSREGLTGKACQSRFTNLLEKHKHFNHESAKASGCSEEYNEKIQLLDELRSLYNDWVKNEATKNEEEKVKKEDEKKKAELVREQAMSRMKHKIEDEDTDNKTPKKQRGLNKVISLLQEDTELNKYCFDKEMEMKLQEKKMEFEYRRQEREEERKDRRQEREEERKERLEIQQKENENFIEMMKVIMGTLQSIKEKN